MPLAAADWEIGGALLVGALAYGASISLYIHAAQRLGAVRAQALFASAPFIGAALSVVLLGEPVTPTAALAAVLLAGSVSLLLGGLHTHIHRHAPLEHLHRHRHDDGHHDHAHADPTIRRHSTPALRTVGDEHEPAAFHVYGPKVIAGIGTLPDTIADRCILIPMRRKPRGVHVKRITRAHEALAHELRRRIARWVADYRDRVAAVDLDALELPDRLNDRARDCWEPLAGWQ